MSGRLLLSAKRSCPIVLLIAALLLPSNAHAVPVDVVSQQYSISGTGYFRDFTYVGTPDYIQGYTTYSETASQPLSKFTDQSYLDPDGPGGSYVLTTAAGGGWSSGSVSVGVSVDEMDEGDAWASGSASATITFRPLATSMSVNTHYEDGGSLTLMDLTANQPLLDSYVYGDETYLLSFDLAHLYAMGATIDGLNWWSSDLSMTIQGTSGPPPNGQPVPEPSTIPLLGIGIFGLVFWGRNRLGKASS